MKEHRLTVSRTARYFVIGEPSPRLRQLWFVLHGYGQLAAPFLQELEVLKDETRLLVAPEALSRFYLRSSRPRVGASWMTREERLSEIEDYLRYLDDVGRQVRSWLGGKTVEVFCLGFSQGAATAARWVCRGSIRVDCLVLWGEALPPEIDDDEAALAKLSSMRLVLVRGTRDRFLRARGCAEQRARLRSREIPFEQVLFEGGHRLDNDTLLRIANDRNVPTPRIVQDTEA